MKRRIAVFLLGAGVAMAGAAGSGLAQMRGKAPAGFEYVSGGVTVGELRTLEKEREKYSLWLTTAAKGSGAHLSDVKVKILDAKKKVVLETTLAGPWLMANLPLGAYTVEATFKDQTQTRRTRIHKGDHHQMVMYFDSPAEVSPEWQTPFKDSPYSGK